MPEPHFMYEYLQYLIRSHWKMCQKSCLKILCSSSVLGKKVTHFGVNYSFMIKFFVSAQSQKYKTTASIGGISFKLNSFIQMWFCICISKTYYSYNILWFLVIVFCIHLEYCRTLWLFVSIRRCQQSFVMNWDASGI